VYRNYPIDKQREFGEIVVAKFGFDFTRGRQDVAVHPFCTSFSCNDVRITTRYNDDWLSPALFGTMHEAGHGMYEQGNAQYLDNNILCGYSSLAVHESQSRMWENVVGRSRAFWNHFYPQLKSTFPESLSDTNVDAFYAAVNASKPSFIRVEADEVTYNLHIMVRFDLEMAVLNGDVAVKDLPDAWNAKYEEYLGITPPDDALGVLQDVHWSSGIMGYFPTYALGNLLSLQFYGKAVEDHPEIPKQIGQGEFDTLREWMRVNIHQHGAKFKPQELVQRVTGTSMQTGPFLGYVTKKFSEIYGL
jgi:carboxypeptidase Taq